MKAYLPSKFSLFMTTFVLFLVVIILHAAAWLMTAGNIDTTLEKVIYFIGAWSLAPSMFLLIPFDIPNTVEAFLAAIMNAFLFAFIILVIRNYLKVRRKKSD